MRHGDHDLAETGPDIESLSLSTVVGHLQKLRGAVEARPPHLSQICGEGKAHCSPWGLPTCSYGDGGSYLRRDRADIAVLSSEFNST